MATGGKGDDRWEREVVLERERGEGREAMSKRGEREGWERGERVAA